MAMTPASGGGECSIAVVPAVLASSDGSGVQQVRESSGDKAEREPTWLNRIAFGVALLEWAGNAAGTLAMLWATVVLLGGFCSLLSRTDFWFSTVMIFTEATRCEALYQHAPSFSLLPSLSMYFLPPPRMFLTFSRK